MPRSIPRDRVYTASREGQVLRDHPAVDSIRLIRQVAAGPASLHTGNAARGVYVNCEARLGGPLQGCEPPAPPPGECFVLHRRPIRRRSGPRGLLDETKTAVFKLLHSNGDN